MEFTKDQICREGIVWQATKYLGETLTLFPQLFGMSEQELVGVNLACVPKGWV